MYGRPFENSDGVQIILPTNLEGLSDTETQQVQGIRKLLEEHRSAIERELGSTFSFEKDHTSKWYIGPFDCNPEIQKLNLVKPEGPQIFLDRKSSLLVTHGQTPSEVTETYSYLRSLNLFEGGVWDIKDCDSIDGAIERVRDEVANSYPAFKVRELDWASICDKHIPLVRQSSDSVVAFQSWLSDLQDAHTWVRPFPPFAELPYDLFVEGNRGFFYRIPKDSFAWEKGVRPGDELLEQDYENWWRRTSASAHSKPYVVGKRTLSSPREPVRQLKVKTVDGKLIEWEEAPLPDRWNPVASWKILDSKNGYLRVNAWMLGKGLEEKIDEAFKAFQDCPKMIVDLRANPGGNLLLSHNFRNRFLDEEGPVGWIQSTLPDGTLSEKESIVGRTVENDKRWSKPVVFLTDPLTYSASEDAMLGLQGRNNVRIVGQPSGGGSGRMRLIRLLEGYRLTISTSLTFDLQGNCIEGNGIPVDVPVSPNISDWKNDATLKVADELSFE